MSEELSTELKILEAAKKVFLAKGFSGCTTREIAHEAGENVALVNYYFRSKAALFDQVFQSAIEELMYILVDIFKSDISLKEKIAEFIDREYAFISSFPGLPMFILSELNREDGAQLKNKQMFEMVANSGVFDQMKEAQESGEMIEIDLYGITVLLMSNCHYPFISKNFVSSLLGVADEHFETLMDAHKIHVKNMILTYLFPTK